MHPRSLKTFGGCLMVLGSMVLACSSSTPAPDEDGSGGSSSVSKDKKGGGGGEQAGGAGSAKSGSGGASASGGHSAGAGAAGTSAGTGGKGTGGASGVGGKTGKGGSDNGGATNGAGGKGNTGPDAATDGKGGKGAGPDSGLPGAGGSAKGTGGSSTDDGGPIGGDGKSAGCGKAPTITSSQYNNGQPISITAASKQRRYILNVPKNYDNSKPYKLIVTIHQLDGNDKQMYNWQYYGLLPLSNDTVIFAAPNGQKNGSPCSGTGDGDSGCGWPNSNGDDMALMDAVVAQVEENFCVDTNHIYATGWSYGASMSYEVGCQRPLGGTGSAKWGVRAIAIYSGRQMSGSCTPSAPVAFYGSHGTNDSVLPYDSGLTLAQNFAKANGCSWATPAKASGSHVCTNLTGCKTGYPSEFCSFVGGHTPYPDNGTAQGSWGPQEAWKFLSQF